MLSILLLPKEESSFAEWVIVTGDLHSNGTTNFIDKIYNNIDLFQSTSFQTRLNPSLKVT